MGVSLTHEIPTKKKNPFSDFQLTFTAHRICSQYYPRISKAKIRVGTSKLVKIGIATTCLGFAITKSCHRLDNFSFSHERHHLEKAGFSKTMVVSVSEELV
uniref:Tick transposon n=1 Tax=Rhipicephalus appendiculatus TaxID=34631 RepID=A0A131YII5_RHIAP